MLLGAALMLVGLQTPATHPDFGKAWDEASRFIRGTYFARESRHDEMEAILKKYGPVAKKATSIAQFSQAMNGMMGEFHDSHFGFYTRADQAYYLSEGLRASDKALTMPNFGAWFKKAKDGYTVSMVLDGTSAKRAGLHKGDVILQIGAKPFTPVSSLDPFVDKVAPITFRRAGKEMHAQVEVKSEPAIDVFVDATRASEGFVEEGGRKYAYMHLWTLASNQFQRALESFVLGRAYKTDGFILDLRDGFGGRPQGYVDPFFRPDVTLSWIPSEDGDPMREHLGYSKPLVVLINRGSRSAKEVVSLIFKSSGRATLIGETTAGDVLGTFPVKLGDWAYFMIPMVDLEVNETRLERNGVDPDFTVSTEFSPDGKDLYMEAAVRFLRENARKQPAAKKP